MSCPRGCPSPQPAELSGTPSAGGGPAQRSFSPLQPSSADPAKAFEWYRRAAVGGEARAQYNIGLLYLSGKGVVADPVQAVKWLVLAASTAAGSRHQAKGAGHAERDFTRAEIRRFP
ncbi:MAG: hypothetical protein GEU92_01125 [Alphaproteobacteria bacterium]|nr:hypothetical protein [Alphaproteobacteria bacterium]